MERNQGRRMSAEEKLGILGEGRQSGATISEVFYNRKKNKRGQVIIKKGN